MTRPSPWKRSTAPERRRQRAAFKAIKQRVDSSPSMAAYRAANRRQAAADRARKKIMRAVLGEATPPLTATEFAAIRPGLQEEARQLRLTPP